MFFSLSKLVNRLKSELQAPETVQILSDISLEFLAQDTQDTDFFAQILSEFVVPGTVIALNGTLGAGKTRFVQAFAATQGISPEDVTSPTFVLIQEYRNGKIPIFHFDAYRLADEDEFLQLGPEEYFDADGISFVEWADRVKTCLPENRFEIFIEHVGTTQRKFTLRIPENSEF
ncbi:MAG: tRNA (adenosine(37)-N6)-threonylcarbamoyltransferase complex ATPase subunit type 1 TsaE [Planctomycetia bacterium]|nr:tRNA (adenosine(37)-N6)-threonylcarbamoyltransferase complex ATPase subunit type 1 TsaE [Planctomycetia bacterium]